MNRAVLGLTLSLVLGLLGCGGTGLGGPGGGGSGGDGGGGHGGNSGVGGSTGSLPPPQNHRPAPATCPTYSSSTDDCRSDADCANGGVCSCAGDTFGWAHATKNSCVPANCHRDADCASGWCSPTVDATCGSFYGVQGYYCHTGGDKCVNDSDCVDSSGTKGYCAWSAATGQWGCFYGFCAG